MTSLVLHVGLDELGQVALRSPTARTEGPSAASTGSRRPPRPEVRQVGAERLAARPAVAGRLVAEVVDHPDHVVHGPQVTAHRGRQDAQRDREVFRGLLTCAQVDVGFTAGAGSPCGTCGLARGFGSCGPHVSMLLCKRPNSLCFGE